MVLALSMPLSKMAESLVLTRRALSLRASEVYMKVGKLQGGKMLIASPCGRGCIACGSADERKELNLVANCSRAGSVNKR